MSSDAFTDLLRTAFKGMMEARPICMVAYVIQYDIETNTATVQPSIKSLGVNLAQTALPPILKVPVVFPCTANSSIVFPIKGGDAVLVVFADVPLDSWKQSPDDITASSLVSQSDIDFTKYNNAIAIPGVFPFAKSKASPNRYFLSRELSDMTITHNIGVSGREAQIKITHQGSIEVNAGTDSRIILDQNGEITIQGATKVTVNTDTAVLNIDTALEVNAPTTTWVGDIDLTGAIVQTGDLTVTGAVGLIGATNHTGTVLANGKDIADTHTHSGGTLSGNTGVVN